ncbi:peptidyl-tRNA hydrolase [Nemania sp. FL0031]|nr:peptidyl-tRNA hydrolase [Nemania sp. FL0031]
MSFPRFLVVSLGNQAPYFDCLHSAGHFALSAAQKLLAPEQPRFTNERYGGKACMVSSSMQYTFIQSPTMMNNCGPWVLAAWKEMVNRESSPSSELGLILVHDELEAAMGEVRIRDWKSSHRGHNGIKSVQRSTNSLKSPHDRWARIAVGIGRPIERTPDVVSEYVLRKMTPRQKQTIENEAGLKVVSCLRELRDR